MQKIRLILFLLLIVQLLQFKPAAAQQQWQPVDTEGFTAGTAAHTSIAIDNNGVPYIAYSDGANGRKATVMKYDGIQWITVGNAGFTSSTVDLVSIAIDENNVPYVAFRNRANFYRAAVMKFDGTNWVAVGNTGFSTWIVDNLTMCFDTSGTPYAAYRENNNGVRATVMKYDGTNWVTVGNAGFTASPTHYPSLAIDSNNTPYIAYRDSNNRLTVRRFDGTNWSSVGTPGFSIGIIDYTSLALDNNGVPYVAYRDRTNGDKATVAKFNGSGWVAVEDVGGRGPGFSAGSIRAPSLVIDKNDVPYVAYADSIKGHGMTVMKYNGTKWVETGVAGFSAGIGSYPSLAIGQNNVPYIVYQDSANGGKATVMKYDDCPAHPKVELCAVFTDTITGSNRLVWDGSNKGYIDSYRVYREDSGKYILLGSVARNVHNFIDVTSTPFIHRYKYKLVVSDSCGRETDFDSTLTHETILLKFNYLLDGKVSISWNKYQGIPNLNYTVKRSNNGEPFTVIDKVNLSGDDTTFLDVNPPSGNNKYRIDIELPNPCNAAGVNYSSITSNVVTAWNTGVVDLTTRQLKFAPNPVDNKLNISFSEEIRLVEIFDMMGKKHLSEKGSGKEKQLIYISDLPPGMYLLNVNGIHKSRFIKR